MNNFSFYNPTKITFGRNTIHQIGDALKRDSITSVLLLAGGGSIKSNGVYETVIKSLDENNIKFVEHFGVRPNPTVEHARIGKKIILENNLQAVLAVGGGSVIDEGKSIAAGYYLNDIWNAYNRTETPQKGLPIYTVLTISGTGTEANMNSVLSNSTLKKKLSSYSNFNFPRLSIIDPIVQSSLPWEQTVNGGIDAITHCMENYFNGSHQETTIAISEALMNTIIKSLDILQEDKNDYNSRANLAWSAVCALNGLTGAGMSGGDWASHKLEHAISAIHPQVAHAQGLAAVFPAWIKFCYDANKPQFERWAKNVWKADNIENGIENMINKFKQWGAPTRIKELDIPKESYPEIIENCIAIAPNIGTVKILSKEDIATIYEIAW